MRKWPPTTTRTTTKATNAIPQAIGAVNGATPAVIGTIQQALLIGWSLCAVVWPRLVVVIDLLVQ
jgi:hypothetical protein